VIQVSSTSGDDYTAGRAVAGHGVRQEERLVVFNESQSFDSKRLAQQWAVRLEAEIQDDKNSCCTTTRSATGAGPSCKP
jgi:hypothetical protein